MANLPVIDATGGTVYMKATGAGSTADPYIPQPNVSGTVVVSGGVAGTVDVNGTAAVRTTNNGTVSISNLPATQPISGTVGVSGTVPISGTVGVSGTVPISGTVGISGTALTDRSRGTGTNTQVFAATATTQLLASNANRKEALFVNAGTVAAYIGPGTPLSTGTAFYLPPLATFQDDRTTGAWHGIVAAGSADIRILEVA